MTSPLQQKPKIDGPLVITANRSGDGAVVYRTAKGDWTKDIARAAVATTATEANRLLAGAIADDLGAVGPYVTSVIVDHRGIRPGNLRESIRLRGPTFDLPGV